MSTTDSATMDYRFHDVHECEMCGAPPSDFMTMGVRQNRSQGLRPRRGTAISVTVQRCRRCHLVFSNPMPVPARPDMHYPEDPEDYWDATYLEEPAHQAFVRELAVYRGLRADAVDPVALDVGAGIGRSMATLERNGFQVTGVEPAKGFARRAIELFGFRPEQMVLATAEDVDFPDETFDFITFGASLEHLYHPGAVLGKAARWLKPGGVIHLEVPSSGWLVGRMINAYYRLSGTSFVTNLSPMHTPFHLYEFSIESFRRHGARHGLEVEMYRDEVCETQLPAILDPLLKPLMKASKSGLQLVAWLRRSAESSGARSSHSE